MMGKTLVAYYSRTGHTRQIAEAIAAQCSAQVEQIRDVRNRTGWLGYWRSAYEALRKRPAVIKDVANNPATYDLVVLGTPVWAGNMSSPMRTYIAAHGAHFTRIAVFCTEGGASGENVVSHIAELCGIAPIATLIVTGHDFASGDFRHKVTAFVNALG